MKFAIKHHYADAVLFEADIPDDTESGLQMRVALEKATAAGANLDGANLDGADLAGANLAGAYLAGAYLARANLAGAYLAGANLDGANLDGAYLDGANLIGERPIFQIGPIGSRCAYLVSYMTDQGIKVRAGCFFGSLDEFISAVLETHGINEHRLEYDAAVQMIKSHAAIWTPTTTESAA